jgi:anhydro-N-acetylmuramic acid kinase
MKNDLYIGIMTGTSMDAIDVVIARFNEFPEVVTEYSTPLNPELKKILMDLATKTEMKIDLFVRTHFVLAKEYAKAARAALKKANLTPKDIRAIGLHGQTIRHLPKPEKNSLSLPEIGATFQLGSGAALAALSGIDVISDFRSSDVALGGEGAPLVPMFDYHFFRSDDQNRILLNIGGIANMTFLPAGGNEESVIAFDTGPGNMVIDELSKELLETPFDEAGSIARNGKIDEDMLLELLKDEYFKRIPPKSTGRELFSGEYSDELKKKVFRGAIFADDAIATATELTARTITDAMSFLPTEKLKTHPTEIIASGGGVKNIFLCERLQELMPGIPFRSSDEVGIPSQAKEALAFAWFAKAFLDNEYIHLPGTTGAKRKILLGSLSKGK